MGSPFKANPQHMCLSPNLFLSQPDLLECQCPNAKAQHVDDLTFLFAEKDVKIYMLFGYVQKYQTVSNPWEVLVGQAGRFC